MAEAPSEGTLGWLQAAIMAVFDWARYICAPLWLVRESIERNLHEDPRRLILNSWVFPVLLTIGTNALVLRFYGIDFENERLVALGFVVFAALKMLVEAFILFGVVRLMRAEVTVGLTFVCFSIVVVYSPQFSWIGIQETVHSYDILALLKAQHLGVADTISYFFDHAKEINEKLTVPIPAMVPYLAVASYAIYLFSTTLVADCLAQVFRLDRPKAYTATVIASVVNYLPVIVFGLFQVALTYAFMSNAFSQH
jgi:hypothetical protein